MKNITVKANTFLFKITSQLIIDNPEESTLRNFRRCEFEIALRQSLI